MMSIDRTEDNVCLDRSMHEEGSKADAKER
jgi:hypothetical protein